MPGRVTGKGIPKVKSPLVECYACDEVADATVLHTVGAGDLGTTFALPPGWAFRFGAPICPSHPLACYPRALRPLVRPVRAELERQRRGRRGKAGPRRTR